MNVIVSPPTSNIADALSLTDHDGCRVDWSSFQGMHTLVFFGFTHCRVVCPRVLSRLTSVLARLGEARECVRPVYITVDPNRDTPEVLKQFLEFNYPRFLGLTGSELQISSLRRRFCVYSGERTDERGDRVVTHSTITYLLDPTGSLADHWLESVGEDALVVRLAGHLMARNL